jgi:sugar (pentulose or hexulose) kinase
MAAYYLAVDIGASSGRHILGHMENGKMVLEEIYRFENGMVKKDGELCWEFDRLFRGCKWSEEMQRDWQDSGKYGCGHMGC